MSPNGYVFEQEAMQSRRRDAVWGIGEEMSNMKSSRGLGQVVAVSDCVLDDRGRTTVWREVG